ncbi:MAG: hypothetical protein AAF386_07340 [Pseudomonadota bacterium]
MHRAYWFIAIVALIAAGQQTWVRMPVGGGWDWLIAASFWALAGAWTYFILAGSHIVLVFVRAGMALVPIAGATGLLVQRLLDIKVDDGIKRALIAAVIVAAGWIVGFVTRELQRTSERNERQADLIRALSNEIEVIVALNARVDWEERVEGLAQEFQKDMRYQTFILYDHQATILNRVVAQVEVLTDSQIPPVMAFFQLVDRLQQLADRMRTDDFKSLPGDRRRDIAILYHRLQAKLVTQGNDTLTALKIKPHLGLLKWLEMR